MGSVSDPEDVTQLRPADLQEVEADEADDSERALPDEADPADVAEQRAVVPLDDDDDRE